MRFCLKIGLKIVVRSFVNWGPRFFARGIAFIRVVSFLVKV